MVDDDFKTMKFAIKYVFLFTISSRLIVTCLKKSYLAKLKQWGYFGTNLQAVIYIGCCLVIVTVSLQFIMAGVWVQQWIKLLCRCASCLMSPAKIILLVLIMLCYGRIGLRNSRSIMSSLVKQQQRNNVEVLPEGWCSSKWCSSKCWWNNKESYWSYCCSRCYLRCSWCEWVVFLRQILADHWCNKQHY